MKTEVVCLATTLEPDLKTHVRNLISVKAPKIGGEALQDFSDEKPTIILQGEESSLC